LVYQNWEKNAPRITENGAKETITRSQDNYDWFREEGNSSNGIHDKFLDPEFAEKILHTELL